MPGAIVRPACPVSAELTAPHSEPRAAAQGDAGAPGSREQRGRRGEGRCLATSERRGWGAEGGMSQGPGAQPGPPSVYHERQRLELCAIHALNNVLQQRLFSQEAADEICKRLAPDCRLNPHRSLLGTGNYDVNVIMAALQGLGLAAVWWDRRRPLSQLALPQVLGLILNLPSPVSLGLLSLPLRRRHWVALRQVDGVYYNLDSKLRAPEALGDEDGVRAFLAAALSQDLCQVLLVVTKEVEEKGCWLQTQ
ncbi:aspartate dehydrogenase domain-containing protein isoform X6 [Desmodus rotundus]|uniref:aspartate dehydrogenase domain-containing protein isoform X6 n=1 Tax=Desmodus rotundus TaxID=9430 RepID=UPI0023815215|nr:josephin-2 isoform X6 [Desmodus rotundus]